MFRCLQGFDMTKRTPISFSRQKLMPVLKNCVLFTTAIKPWVFLDYLWSWWLYRTLAAIDDFNGKGTPVAPLVLVMIKRVLLNYSIYTRYWPYCRFTWRLTIWSGWELPYAQDLVRFIREHSGDILKLQLIQKCILKLKILNSTFYWKSTSWC